MAEEKTSEQEQSSSQQEVFNGESELAKDLRAAFDEADQKAIDEEVEKVDEEPEEEDVKEEAKAEESSSEEEESEELSLEEESSEEESDEEEEEAADEEEDSGKPPISAPTSWSAADKVLFQGLPRQVQEIVLRRETERDTYLTQKAKEAEQLKRDYELIEDAIAPYEENWDVQGLSAADAIRQSVAIRQALNQNPIETLQWLAQQTGVDLSKVSEASSQVDPKLAELQAQQQALQAQLAQQQQAAVAQSQELATREVDNWSKQTDSSGNLLRPHFNEVWQDMKPFVSHIKSANPSLSNKDVLQEAYDKAVWSNPATRDRLQAESRKVKEAKRQKAQKEKVAKAKKASKSVSGVGGPSMEPSKDVGLREQLEQLWDSASA